MDYDVIGDLHGQADKLEQLLHTLGYRDIRGAWRHPGRQAVFVGDYIDRGPAQLRCVDTVRRMVDAGSAQAILGNHELNAMAWHTPDANAPGEFLRPHHRQPWGDRNRRQHAAFLAEVEHAPARHAEVIDWFMTLPLWLELPGLHIVHACWHRPMIDWLRGQLRDGCCLSPDLLPHATQRPAEISGAEPFTLFEAVETLTKGIEVQLPDTHSFKDKDGIERHNVRVRWWDPNTTNFRAAALMPEADRAALPELPLPAGARPPLERTPVFFGHYWLTGTPAPLSASAACVDYSAGKGGALVAYRFSGETTLDAGHFVAVA